MKPSFLVAPLRSLAVTLSVLTVPVSGQEAWPILNEIVSSNLSGPPDAYEPDLQNCPVPDCAQWYRDLGESVYDGDYPDWIELHNPSDGPLSLEGYGLSDDPAEPFKWVFPEVTLDPGGYFIVFASGRERADIHPHATFKIDRKGETIVLTEPGGGTVDLVSTGEMPVDFSLGRRAVDDGSWALYREPTPGEPNLTPVFPGFSDTVMAAPESGFYQQLPAVELSTQSGSGEIRYTTDGSEPTAESRLYTRPITALFAQNHLIRARSFADDQPTSPIITRSYFSGRSYSLPVISLATPPANLWDDDIGIYTPGPNARESDRVANYWNDWERPVHVEFFDPDGRKGFEIDAGLQIFGWGSRSDPQKSLSLMFRDRYGHPELDYPIFPKLPVEQFTSLVLRAGGSDSHGTGTFFRDPFATSLVRHRDVDIQAMRPAIVYLNGDYWGIHNIREKMNEDYLASHHGVDPDDVDIVSRYWRRQHVVVIEGDALNFEQLETFLQENDLSDPAIYEEAKRRIDIPHFLDYTAAQIYFANYDWPGNNNKNWRARTPDAKWRWLMYDLDYTMGFNSDANVGHNTLAHALNPSGSGWPNPSWTTLILRKLAENESFRHAFATRLADLVNTVFEPGHAVAELEAMQGRFAPEMEAHIQRWAREGNAISSLASWKRNIDTVRSFLEQRPERILEHVKNTFDLQERTTVELACSPAKAGKLKLNSIVVDTSPWSGTYFQGLPVRLQALPAPGYRFSHWSGLDEANADPWLELVPSGPLSLTAHFEEDQTALNAVVINEIHYHGADGSDPGEWVELYNGYGVPVDLTGWMLRDEVYGHRFAFPEDTTIEPAGYLVICQDRKTFRTQFPDVGAVVGDLPFRLGNGGDSVRLYDASQQLVDSVTYDDRDAWPVLPDGTGRTLILTAPDRDNAQADAWLASATPMGTPGAPNDEGLGRVEGEIQWPLIRAKAKNVELVLEFPSAPSVRYRLETSSDLRSWETGDWQDSPDGVVTMEVFGEGNASYFRLRLEP